MKTNAIVRIILFSIVILLLVGILAVALLGDLFIFRADSFHESTDELPMISEGMTTQGSIHAAGVQNIDIEWVAGSITIVPAENTNEIVVQETNHDKYKMELSLDGDTLRIRYSEDTMRIIGFNHNGSKDLIITVPADWICNNLDIEAAAAEVTIHDLTFNEVDLESASGKCNFSNCTVNRFDVETVSGDICMNGSVNSFNCDAVSADCHLELNNHPRSITSESVSGDLEIILPADCGFSYSKDTVSGSFHTDFDCSGQGDVYIHGDGTCQIQINGVSGNVDILKSTEINTGKNCDH